MKSSSKDTILCLDCLDSGYMESIGDRRKISFPCMTCQPRKIIPELLHKNHNSKVIRKPIK